MKKNTLFFSLSLLVITSSCHLNTNKKDFSEITTLVDNIEIIVDKYDNNVQSALDSKKFDYINTVSKSAIDSSSIKLNELKNISVATDKQALLAAAIKYIESLQELISAEKLYSSMTDTTSIEIAEKIDNQNLAAINKVESSRLNYVENLNAASK